MQVRALVRFDSRYGPVRAGDIFTAEEGYAQGLIKGRKVERVREDVKPDRRAVVEDVPRKKATGLDVPPQVPESTQGDGKATPSPSSRAGRASRKRTPSTAGPAAK